MARFKELITVKSMQGNRITTADVSVTPQSQAFVVRWPNGGWVWNRPVAVLMEQDDQTSRIPIVDVTRVIQWGLWGLSTVFVLVTLALSIRSLTLSIKRSQ